MAVSAVDDAASIFYTATLAVEDAAPIFHMAVSAVEDAASIFHRAVVVVEFHHFRLPGHPRRWNQARYRTYQRPIQLTSSLGHDTHL